MSPEAVSAPEAAPHGAPRLTLNAAPITVSRTNAAAMLDMSVDSFERYVQPQLRIVRCGRMRLFPVVELERWARENADPLFS